MLQVSVPVYELFLLVFFPTTTATKIFCCRKAKSLQPNGKAAVSVINCIQYDRGSENMHRLQNIQKDYLNHTIQNAHIFRVLPLGSYKQQNTQRMKELLFLSSICEKVCVCVCVCVLFAYITPPFVTFLVLERRHTKTTKTWLVACGNFRLPGMRINTRYLNFSIGTSSKKRGWYPLACQDCRVTAGDSGQSLMLIQWLIMAFLVDSLVFLHQCDSKWVTRFFLFSAF